MEGIIEEYKTIWDFQRPRTQDQGLAKITLANSNVDGVMIENGSDDWVMYIERTNERTYNLPVQVGDSREFESKFPFSDDFYVHFADPESSFEAKDGNAIVIIRKIVRA